MTQQLLNHVRKAFSPSGAGAHLLQRKCACGAKAGGGECDQCKKKQQLRRKPSGRADVAVAGPDVHAALNEGGQPLASGVRGFFESRFGHDLSQVRVHADARAEASARTVEARAYTVGEHIVFGRSQYDPASRAGQLLLAHELTHVLQQRPGLHRSAEHGGQPAMGISSTAPAQLRRAPFPGVITRCREQGVPCPAPYAYGGSICRLIDCYSAKTSNLPGAVSPGVCIYKCENGKTCACVLVGSKTAAVCTFTFCDEPGQANVEPDTQDIANRALAMAGQQGGSEGAPVNAQAKLEIGAVDDPLEQEADRVASRIVEGGGAGRWPMTDRQSGFVSPASMPGAFAPSPASRGFLRRVPDLGGGQGGEERRRHDGMLSYRESTELLECTRIMGEDNADYCREQVLGEKTERPRFKQVAGITSPQPYGTKARADGSTNFTVGNVVVTFLPDTATTDVAKTGAAETTIDIAHGGIHFTSKQGKIDTFTGPGPAEATIRTTYGPGATASGTSGYGRGTTVDDKTAGTTSLGFHEGQHGVDFQDFLATHRFPTFTGTKGMTENAFKGAMTTYFSAADAFSASIRSYSEQKTDCVGFTIDQANAAASANGGTVKATVCKKKP
jgi:hypothetical protein